MKRRKALIGFSVFVGVILAFIAWIIVDDELGKRRFFRDCSFQGGQPVQTSAQQYICVGDDGRIIPITS